MCVIRVCSMTVLIYILIFYELNIVLIFKVGAIPEIRMRCNYTNFKMNMDVAMLKIPD